MPDQRIVTFEGKTQIFPGDATDAEISAALGAIPTANAKDVPKAKTWALSDGGAVAMAGAAKSVAPAADALAAFGTSPTVAKTIGTVANVGTTLSGVAHGLATGNIPEVIASPAAGWSAGKGGYFLGKGMQSLARPVATALEKAAPYAQALSTAAGAQGALDLAQMAEPNRKDIGTLGVTVGDTHDPQHPALVNLLAMKAADAIKYLISEGLSLGEASRTYWNAKAKASR